MKTDERKLSEDEKIVKKEEVVKDEELEALAGGVSSMVEQPSTGIFGTAGCCNDVVTNTSDSLQPL